MIILICKICFAKSCIIAVQRKLTAVYGVSCCKYTIICKRIADKFAQKIFCALRPSFSVFQTESTSDRFSNVMNCSGFARRRPKTFLYSSYFRLSVPITFAVLWKLPAFSADPVAITISQSLLFWRHIAPPFLFLHDKSTSPFGLVPAYVIDDHLFFHNFK